MSDPAGSGPAGSFTPDRGGSQDILVGRKGVQIPLPMIVRAEGIRMWDAEGRDYIDASSGPVVSNIGHGVAEVGEAIREQIATVDFASTRLVRHGANIALADRIAALAGEGFERVSLSSGGSEAVEIAVKFLRTYALARGETERRHVITCMPSYHGATYSALAWSGDSDLVGHLDGMVVPQPKIPAPISYRLPGNHSAETYAMECTDKLRQEIARLGPESVLAFMIEPVGGLATGGTVPPEAFFREVRRICDETGVRLIFDEVMSGSGRSGKFLAAHHWPGARPDVVVLAKGLGAGYVPLGATLFPAEMADWLAEATGFGFAHTYTANPVACAAGCAVLDYVEAHGLIENAARMGAYLKARMEELKARLPIIGDVRGLGLHMAVEMVADPVSKAMLPPAAAVADRVRVHGLKHGLLIYSRRTSGGEFGEWFMLAPPLTITRDECDALVARLEATLASLAGEMAREGMI